MEKINKIIHLFYNLGQFVLLPPLLPFFTIFALSKEKYKNLFFPRLGFGLYVPKAKGSKRVWIHTLSLGEFHGATTLIKEIQKEFKNLDIILSASTNSGFNAIKNSSFSKYCAVIPAPYDINLVTKKFINYIQPDLFILIETDIWPNLLWGLKKSGTKTMLINGSISSKAANTLRKFPFIANYLYGPFSFIGMQSDDDVKRLNLLNIKKNVLKIGNIKFDLDLTPISKEEKKALFNEIGFNYYEDKIFIAGSTHHPEEQICIDVFCSLKEKIPKLKLIIAPRDIKRGDEIKQLCISKGLKSTLRTEKHKDKTVEILILNTLGELTKFYNICQLAFVGGSFAPIGGHNILEPIFLGKPVIFGPHMESFKEIAQTVHEKGAGFMVNSKKDFFKKAHLFLTNQEARLKTKEIGSSLIKENRGVVKKYIEIISTLLKK